MKRSCYTTKGVLVLQISKLAPLRNCIQIKVMENGSGRLPSKQPTRVDYLSLKYNLFSGSFESKFKPLLYNKFYKPSSKEYSIILGPNIRH
jgi:hypothetical protein